MSQAPNPANAQFQLDLNPVRRKEFLAACNEKLQAAREKLVKRCRKLGGGDSCRKFSDEIDSLLVDIYKWLAGETKIPAQDYARIAIVAQGGYGRREMNLHSDVDLLFLMPDNTTPVEQAFVRSFLYCLWDLNKLDLGYCTKRAGEVMSSVGMDLDSTTALIEMRLVAGNETLLTELSRKLFAQLHGSSQKWFILSKIAEWKNRREKFGQSVYLLEPNIKEGEGGLRDVHSMQWLAYVVLEAATLEELADKGVLSRYELDITKAALDFLLCVRNILHACEGRKVDVLSFDKQPGVASALGYESDSHFLAEEKMMKDYYLHARTIDRYSQKVNRMLTSRARSIIGGMFEAIRRHSLNAFYYSKNNVLFLKQPAPDFFVRDVSRIMECFWLATRMGLTMSEELKDVLIEARFSIDVQAFQTSPVCRDLFMKIVGHRGPISQTIHAMHDTEILSDYFPEFGNLFCVARIDHYHKYTVDEHLIKTLEISEALVQQQPEQPPELIAVATSIRRWDLLNLSLLLHDIGKGEGHGHVLRGAILSQKMTQRMGLPPEDQETVRQLVLLHLRMNHVSQRRDLDDPHVIADMANTVPDISLLEMLYVLTYCDTRAVSPTAWSDWKGVLLHDLYRKTRLALEGKDPMVQLDESAHRKLVDDLRASAPELTLDQIEHFINNAPTKYLTSFAPQRMIGHMRLLSQLTPQNRIVWEVEEPEHYNYTEISAVSYDVPGFMSLVCGALASKDVNILSVQVFSTKDGYAVDTFQVTDLRGNKLPHGFRLDRLRNDLNSVLLGKAKAPEKFPIRKRKREVRTDLATLKPSVIVLDNDSSPSFTLLEIKTFDRPGLLFDITSTCAEQGYYIHLAMITTEAYRVVDVFYITDLEFNKLEPAQGKKLHSALEKVIE